jgi:hypothetical protein
LILVIQTVSSSCQVTGADVECRSLLNASVSCSIVSDHNYRCVQTSVDRKHDLDDSETESAIDGHVQDLHSEDCEVESPSKFNQHSCNLNLNVKTSWTGVSNSVLNFDIQCDDAVLEMFSEAEETLISYLCGWVARKSGICKTCVTVLTKPNKEHSYECRAQDLFASKKRYSDSSAVGLINPSKELFVAVHLIEQIFRMKYKEAMTKPNVVNNLFGEIHSQCDFLFLFYRHPEHALYLSEKITKLYLTMRMYYVVKFFNRDLKAPTKSSESVSDRRCVVKRKMQKILHE